MWKKDETRALALLSITVAGVLIGSVVQVTSGRRDQVVDLV